MIGQCKKTAGGTLALQEQKKKRLTKQLILAGNFPELRELIGTNLRNQNNK